MQCAVIDIINQLRTLYEEDFFDPGTIERGGGVTKAEGGSFGVFVRSLWNKNFIQTTLLRYYEQSDYVYHEIHKYVSQKGLNEYVKPLPSPENTHPLQKAGRKKPKRRTKRNKSKIKKSKRKKSKRKKTRR